MDALLGEEMEADEPVERPDWLESLTDALGPRGDGSRALDGTAPSFRSFDPAIEPWSGPPDLGDVNALGTEGARPGVELVRLAGIAVSSERRAVTIDIDDETQTAIVAGLLCAFDCAVTDYVVATGRTVRLYTSLSFDDDVWRAIVESRAQGVRGIRAAGLTGPFERYYACRGSEYNAIPWGDSGPATAWGGSMERPQRPAHAADVTRWGTNWEREVGGHILWFGVEGGDRVSEALVAPWLAMPLADPDSTIGPLLNSLVGAVGGLGLSRADAIEIPPLEMRHLRGSRDLLEQVSHLDEVPGVVVLGIFPLVVDWMRPSVYGALGIVSYGSHDEAAIVARSLCSQPGFVGGSIVFDNILLTWPEPDGSSATWSLLRPERVE